jgi:hypothetical protein
VVAPKILIFHTLRWPNAARLALAFRAADCSVHGLCQAGQELSKLSEGQRSYEYRPFLPLRSLCRAIEAVEPDLIVLCDDPALAQLLRLYDTRRGPGASERRIRALIERSLGVPGAYGLLAARSKLTAVAESAGVQLPQSGIVSTIGEVREWLRREGFPAVLKADHTWGGRGVAVVRTMREAELAFRRMTGLPGLAREIKGLVRDRNPLFLLRRLRHPRPLVTAQAFVRGKPANCAVACWKGEVVAHIAVEVIEALGPTGNATVVRVVENREMYETAARVVRSLGISGLCSFHFVLEESSGRARLIEINPRATQTDHLALGAGRDLPAALRARLANEPVRESRPVTEHNTIALFPQEYRRDPASRFLLTAYQDVPREHPELVKAYVGASLP